MSNYRARITSLLLALVLLFTFTACSSKPSSSSEGAASASSEPEFYNPLEEPAGLGNAATPVTPDKTVTEKIKEHKTKNADTVGWLRVPGTDIDDIVVQSKANNNKYLRLDNLGKYSFEGCFYADYRNTVVNRASLDSNTVIYGHNLGKPRGVKDDPDAEMFAQLLRYLDVEFAKENPYIYLTTEQDEMVFKVFAVFYTNWRKFDYIQNKFETAAAFNSLVTEAKASSELNYDVNVTATDKILTLSTCTYKFGTNSVNNDQRFVVMARLLHANEKDTDPVTVVKNPSPKVPTF